MTSNERHFRNLYLLKTGCILVAGFTFFLIVIFSFFNILETRKNEMRALKDIKFSNLNLKSDSTVNVKELSITGKSSSDSKYELTAGEANKDTQGVVQMKDVEFFYTKEGLEDKLKITSAVGEMKEQEKLINIESPVKLDFMDYHVETNKLEIDLKNNSAKSNSPITATKGNSLFKADKFNTTENSEIIYLNGNVKASIHLSDTESR
jgi:LPS export ABC transporter protein LptC